MAAPRASAAATPTASAMPPAAMTGLWTPCTICGSKANVPLWRVRSSERKWPRCRPASRPPPLEALGGDRVDTAPLEPKRCVEGRRAGEHLRTHATYPRQECLVRQPEVKADDSRADLLEQLGRCGIERNAARAAG